MSSFGRSRNNVDTRLIGFPPRTTMRGGNDIAILHHLYLPVPLRFPEAASRSRSQTKMEDNLFTSP
ncbi:MAG: hypothetical protein IIC00_02320 [Planctomycetes bacterium]|nr:hypothetical protein [Planctomycetota bacterium]